MRDALVLLFIIAALLVALRYPFAGILTWVWFTLITPHQMAYGVYGVPLNTIIAGVTIGSILLHQDFRRGRLDTISILVVLFAGWLFVAQFFSLNPQNSMLYTDRFIKTLVLVVLCAQLANDKLRLHALLWTIVISLGYFGAKGGLFTLLTLGEYRVQGIENTVLEDNNHMGIALATSLPLFLYLRTVSSHVWVKSGLTVVLVLTIVAIFGTHSRGAFLSLLAFSAYLWTKSSHKVSILAALMVVMVPAVIFMPAKWTERMATIGEATQDASFMGRIDAWVINSKLAVENPITGAGLRNSYDETIAERVDPIRAPRAKAAHSIYFEVLGGAGFVGFSFYVSIIIASFMAARRNYQKRTVTDAPEWTSKFGYYMQISLAVFLVGGASVSLEMWDGYWLIIAMIAALSRLSDRVAKPFGYALHNKKRLRWRVKARGYAPGRSGNAFDAQQNGLS